MFLVWMLERKTYTELPLRLPQSLDRPFMGVDGIEPLSQDPRRHGEEEYCRGGLSHWMLVQLSVQGGCR